MDQLIGKFKEFIVIERIELDKIETLAKQKLENNKDRPLSESSIEARAVLNVIQWIKDTNIYGKEFQIKN